MATFTPNYSLRKPASTDFVDFSADLNANWDIVDTQLKTNADNIKVPQVKIKTVDTSRPLTTVLADDPHLLGFSLTAGKNYELEGLLFLTSSTIADFKLHFDWTGVATANGQIMQGADVVGFSTVPADGTFLTGTFVIDGTGGSPFIVLHAMIFCTTTGILDFQWAQNTSDAGATTLRKHSFIKVTEIVAT